MSSSLKDNKKIKLPLMRDLTEHLDYALKHGYTQSFQVTPEGLKSLESSKVYMADELLIVNFYRYEGISDPEDNSILYLIETSDGAKGTLVDAYGAYSDPEVENFMKDVRIDDKEK
jgi:hypothetical protein